MEKAAEVEVPSNEINMVLQHVGVEPTPKGKSLHHVFLATLLWIWTEQNVIVGESATEERRGKPRTNKSSNAPCVLCLKRIR